MAVGLHLASIDVKRITARIDKLEVVGARYQLQRIAARQRQPRCQRFVGFEALRVDRDGQLRLGYEVEDDWHGHVGLQYLVGAATDEGAHLAPLDVLGDQPLSAERNMNASKPVYRSTWKPTCCSSRRSPGCPYESPRLAGRVANAALVSVTARAYAAMVAPGENSVRSMRQVQVVRKRWKRSNKVRHMHAVLTARGHNKC